MDIQLTGVFRTKRSCRVPNIMRIGLGWSCWPELDTGRVDPRVGSGRVNLRKRREFFNTILQCRSIRRHSVVTCGRSWHYVLEACRRRCNEHSETHCLSCLGIHWEEVQLQHSVCQRCKIAMRSIRQSTTFSSHSMASRRRASCRRAGFSLSQNMLIYCWVGFETMAIESSCRQQAQFDDRGRCSLHHLVKRL